MLYAAPVRPIWLLLVLLPLTIGVVTVLAWERAGRDRYAALEREGAVVAGVIHGAALEAAETVAMAERNLAERLASVARRSDIEVATTRAPAEDILAAIALEERVGRIFLFDAAKEPVAYAQWPAPAPDTSPGILPPGRKREILWADARAAIEGTGLDAGGVRVEGLVANAFGTRERFGVAVGRRAGGVILVRAHMDELTDLRRQFGLGPLLQRIMLLPAVERILLEEEDGGEEVIAQLSNEASVHVDDVTLLRTRQSLALPNGERYAVDVGLSPRLADAAVANSRRAIGIGALLALVVSLGAAWLLLIREASVRRLQARAATRLEEERRLAEMGALAGLVTHEVNNPLNAVRLGLAILKDADPNDVQESVLGTMNEEVERMAHTLEGYMAIARSDVRVRRDVGPALLAQVRARTAVEARHAGVTLELQTSADAPDVSGDPVVLEQALSNVVRNALQNSDRGDRVQLEWRRGEDGMAVITIRDHGAGFPENRDALLRLGGTRRDSGHGLGLPLAKRFVESHGGRLTLEDAPGGGALVRIRLPAADEGEPRDA